MLDFLENLYDFFSNGDEYTHDAGDNTCIFDGIDATDIDLSNYSADDIEDAIRSALDSDHHDYIMEQGHDISFCGSHDVDMRNIEKSSLLDKLSSNHISTTTSISTDKLWGGLDSYSGQKVADAINQARDHGNISDSTYRDLMSQLKKACHTQS